MLSFESLRMSITQTLLSLEPVAIRFGLDLHQSTVLMSSRCTFRSLNVGLCSYIFCYRNELTAGAVSMYEDSLAAKGACDVWFWPRTLVSQKRTLRSIPTEHSSCAESGLKMTSSTDLSWPISFAKGCKVFWMTLVGFR